MGMKRWQDWVNLILGVWLFLSTWIMGYADAGSAAAWNAWILGVGVFVFAAIAVSMPKVWEEVINVLLGIWLIISPWVLGFTDMRRVETNTVIVGIIVLALAAWAMAMARHQVTVRHQASP
ncbi:MAG TPA: SPW repeat protein [Casimicrobiaceae bacterium]|nr:SPW repeat protein [Casimicrobiaceae bacterium]